MAQRISRDAARNCSKPLEALLCTCRLHSGPHPQRGRQGLGGGGAARPAELAGRCTKVLQAG
eukprot:8914345-Alexandrium_andersonii.AAC.1